ncbi:protein Hook-like protein 2 [Platysternon megacephalum]|uniref:Protein Hook-like protein 2 n=1 Tax=Platysternon megacephalum TaxID=55544 RepID=A0A4D9E2I2_9SAUR|nr:protein Hook-like protein 2 [Platysternon megacephalum]
MRTRGSEENDSVFCYRSLSDLQSLQSKCFTSEEVTESLKMKVSLLCLCLFSIACAEPVFQSHSGKAKENCSEHHKILVRGHNLKHGYYIFKYVYASSIRKNQTQIKKEEENNKSNVSTHRFNNGDELTKLTEEDSRIQERGEDQKYIGENGIARTSENRSISDSRQKFIGVNGNTSSWDTHHHLEVIIHKDDTEITTGNIIADIEGSGDLDFLDHISVNAHHDRGSGQQDTRGTGHTEVLGKDKDKDGAGLTSNNEPDSTGSNVTGEKDEAKVSDSARDISKKNKDMSQDPESTGYSDQDGTKDREPGNEGSGYTGFLDKEEEDVATSNGNAHHDIRGNSSTDIPEKMDDARVDAEGTEDYTYLPATDEVKTIKGKSSSHVEGPGFTKEHKKGEVNILSGRACSCVEEPDVTEAHIKEEVEGNISGRASSQRERLGSTKKHKKDKGENNIPSRKVSSHIQEPDVTKSLKKDKGERSIINVSVSSHVERPGFTETHNKDGSDVNKSNGNAYESKLRISYTEAPEKGRTITGIRFRDGKNDLTERGTSYSKAPGNGPNVKISARVPTTKTENISHKYIRGKDDTRLHASQHHSEHINKIKKTDEIHTFYVLGNDGNVIKTNEKSKKNNTGTDRQYTAKAYQGSDRVLRRKDIRHDKKDQSAKSFRGNNDDRSQSSDSQNSSRSDSHQSYEVYQNDQPGSYQSAQGIQDEEYGLSAENNQSENHSQMAEQETDYSHEH